MEENDLPIVVRCRKLFLEPPDLLRLGVGALEREETDVWLRAERVVELPSHGKQLVEALLARVVVAQRRVEFHGRLAAACKGSRTSSGSPAAAPLRKGCLPPARRGHI